MRPSDRGRADIHPSAVVSPEAKIAEGVHIGPFCVVGPEVSIGRDTVLVSHVVLRGRTSIGERNRIYPFCVLGAPPQDVGYRGEDTRLVIGDDNILREHVTIHRASTKENWETVVGNHNYLMAYSHVAHDCHVGNHVIMVNAATLGGHTRVGDHATLGAFVAVHQFVRIGPYAFLGAKSGIDRDVPPFMMAAGERVRLYGVNRKGLAREGFSREVIDGLKWAYRIIWCQNRPLNEALRVVQEEVPPSRELDMLVGFFDGSKRGVLR